MDAHTALMLSAATVSAGGALVACIQAERATRAERAARHNSEVALEAAYAAEDAADRAEAADANTRQRVAELRELAAEHMAAIDPLLEALNAVQARLGDATAPAPATAEPEPERGSPEYWEARHGVAMRDRHGRPVTVYYDSGDLITVKPHDQASEWWHRLSPAALDLRLPHEPARDTVPTALPSQGPGA